MRPPSAHAASPAVRTSRVGHDAGRPRITPGHRRQLHSLRRRAWCAPSMSAVVRGAITVAALALVVYYGSLFMGQRRLLYPRPRGPAVAPPVDGIVHVQLASGDGPVHVWHAPSRARSTSPRRAIVFAHGNGERAEDWLDQFGDVQAAGLDVLIVEYPGYGIAEGS